MRIALGDPDGPNIAERGEEEGIGDAMSARISNALTLYRPLCAVENIEIRLHRTVLYNSIYRGEEDHQQSKQVSGLDSGQVTTWTSWHRRTAICLLAYIFLAVAAAFQRTRDEDAGILGLIPVTIPELLRQLRGTVIPEPRRDRAHCDGWSLWRRRHQYRARQAHQRWQAYADALPE